MKVYFAGSIKGGRTHARSYRRIVETLVSLGCDVLNPHVAAEDPTVGEPGPTEVYERDMAWLRSSDLLVADVTQPSLGVGYEIGVAVSSRKPVLCLHRNDVDPRSLSFMIQGNTEPHLAVRRFDESSLDAVLRDFIVSHQSRTPKTTATS
jgi:nucleoside 2-deoxyribosyltransferase